MQLNTEIVEEKQKALIISKTDYPFIRNLKNKLKNSSVDCFFSPEIPKSLLIFDYCFFINKTISLSKISLYKNKKIIFIFINSNKKQVQNHSDNIKIINIKGNNITDKEIDKILWFSFSKTKESFFYILTTKPDENYPPPQKPNFKTHFLKFFTKKAFLWLVIILFFLYHLLYLPPLAASTLTTYYSYDALKKENFLKSEELVKQAEIFFYISQKFYGLSRPTFLLFGLALPSDTLFDINLKGQTIINETISTVNNAKQIENLILKQDKSEQEISTITLRFAKLKDSLNIIENNLTILNQKIPTGLFFSKKIKDNLSEMTDSLSKAGKILSYFQNIIKNGKEKKYLLLFANDRELRPGGGFLGSFGILTIGNYSVKNIEIHDVYDADGQLTGHIDPPIPIKKYLSQPHWFLRDSDFSPDFTENYNQALFFLDKEINLSDFQGGILITTTAIENILTAFPDIYLPDYKEYINSKNFYLKTQLHVETNFFPGSTQKKTYLSSLASQLMLNLENISYKKLAVALKKSLDEKQIVAYFTDQNIQTFFDSSYWSGRVINSQCTIPQDNCLVDYAFPYDANVGANKANFFINRYLDLKTSIDNEGQINHVLSIQYKNSSPGKTFTNGLYRNYFQLLIPKNSNLKQVLKDGVLIEKDEIDQKDSLYKTIGFFFEVAPQKTVEIKIFYSLNETLKQGRNIYQLIFQKQTGATNSDLVLEFDNNKKIDLLNQNFSPVVKDNKMIYNTSLSADKIFLIELNKE